jgi:hypothetical protein
MQQQLVGETGIAEVGSGCHRAFFLELLTNDRPVVTAASELANGELASTTEALPAQP